MPVAVERDDVVRLLREKQAQLVEVLPARKYEDEHLPGRIIVTRPDGTLFGVVRREDIEAGA